MCIELICRECITEEETKRQYKRIQSFLDIRSVGSIVAKCRNYVSLVNNVYPHMTLNPHIKPLSGVERDSKILRTTDSELLMSMLLVLKACVNK